MYYTLHGGQTYSGAFKRVVGMEALEHTEQFVRVFHVEAHSIIPNEYYYVIRFLVGTANFDFRLRAGPGEFSSVGYEVDKYEAQHGSIPVAGGQCPNFPIDVATLGFLPNLA
jgi:hypothetical protein